MKISFTGRYSPLKTPTKDWLLEGAKKRRLLELAVGVKAGNESSALGLAADQKPVIQGA